MLSDKELKLWQERLYLREEEIEPLYAHGFAQYQAGNWEKAAEVFWLLVSRRPLEKRFWFSFAAVHQEMENYREALHGWAMSALLEKGDPLPHFHAAECCFSLGDVEEGHKALRAAEAQCSEGDVLREKIELLKKQWGGT